MMLVACDKGISIPEDEKIESLKLNISVSYANETKAKKSGWVVGDKIFIFFRNVTSGYLTITYDGLSWGNASMNGITVNHLEESGSTLTAVYLPFGSESIPSFDVDDERWSFDSAADTYFLRAQQQSYTVTKEGSQATLNATLNMTAPSGFIQFFVPDEDATGTARLSCNNIYPSGLTTINPEGVIYQVNYIGTGNFMTGYAATINGEKGYYFYGKFNAFNSSTSLRYYYYFALEKDGKYYDYYKYSNQSDLGNGSNVKLPNMRQVGPGIYTHATIGGYTWSTVNYGSTKPWQYDATQYSWNNVSLPSGESIPSKEQLEAFVNGSKRIRMNIGGVMGYMCLDINGSGGYIFLSASGMNETLDSYERSHYWSSTEYDATSAYEMYFNVSDPPKVSSSGTDKNMRLSIRTIKP